MCVERKDMSDEDMNRLWLASQTMENEVLRSFLTSIHDSLASDGGVCFAAGEGPPGPPEGEREPGIYPPS